MLGVGAVTGVFGGVGGRIVLTSGSGKVLVVASSPDRILSRSSLLPTADRLMLSVWLDRKSRVELVLDPILEFGPRDIERFLTSVIISSYLSEPTDGSLLTTLPGGPLLAMGPDLAGLLLTGATGGGSSSSRGGGAAPVSSGGLGGRAWGPAPACTEGPETFLRDIGTGSASSWLLLLLSSSSCSLRSCSSSSHLCLRSTTEPTESGWENDLSSLSCSSWTGVLLRLPEMSSRLVGRESANCRASSIICFSDISKLASSSLFS